MTKPESLIFMDRRRFVQAGAATATAVACLPAGLWAAPAELTTAKHALTVGVLLPLSLLNPSLGPQLLAGMQAWVEQHGDGKSLRLKPVFYGQRASQAREAALDIGATQKVDVLAAFVCRNAAGQWAPDLAQQKMPLLVCDTGANAAQTESLSPWVVGHSLGYWQASWAAGQWAARNLGRRAVVAVGAMESGFDMLPAFQRGYASAGGEVLMVHFTHMPDGSSRLAELASLVRTEQPDFVFSLDRLQSARGLTALWRQEELRDVPLVVGGMLAEASSHSDAAWRVLPWHADRRSIANARFLAAMGAVRPTGMHLLGYESAQRLAAGIAASEGAGGLALAAAMSSLSLETPRGHVRNGADGETQARAFILGSRHSASPAVLGSVDVGVCADVCSTLASRVTDTYLV